MYVRTDMEGWIRGVDQGCMDCRVEMRDVCM